MDARAQGRGEERGFAAPAPRPPGAALLGTDAPLTALLADVLRDEGVRLAPPGAGADVVLALVGRSEALAPVLRRAVGPVIVLLPFADERLQRRALELGAHGCFALGRPLAELRALVRGALEGPDFEGDAARSTARGDTA
ncbi:MAG TPA: DNA-binding response regulator [Aggregicoccus sp.]|nr:DNA-binding response regulator [Aggregicoccus sp.]